MPQQRPSPESEVPAQDSQLVLQSLSAQMFHPPGSFPLLYPCFYLPLTLNLL